MTEEFAIIFERLKQILKKHSKGLEFMKEKPGETGLLGEVGPATLAAWKGKMRHPKMMVAWIKVGKGYVSYHLLGLYMNPKLEAKVPKELAARRQGKACFNFKKLDEVLLVKLDKLTGESIESMRKGGWVGPGGK